MEALLFAGPVAAQVSGELPGQPQGDASQVAPQPPAFPPPSPGPMPASTSLGSAAPTAEPSVAAASCFPACRSGFLCSGNRCISRCNPPCEAGLECTDDARCVLRRSELRAARLNEDEVDATESAHQESARRERESTRELARLTLHGLVTATSMLGGDVVAGGMAATVGYRQNLLARFGLQARLGAGIALPTVDDRSPDNGAITTDSSSMTEVWTEFAPFFGPFGRFYIGPMVWCSRFWFEHEQLLTRVATYQLKDTWKVGAGLDMGVLLLRHEQLDINWRLKTTASDQMPLRLEVGVGYHLM